MATTVDSGTETLFSDEGSPSCDELSSSPPTLCSGGGTPDAASAVLTAHSNRLAPPNIQPYSGVLEKGKVVIRPIAFKPTPLGGMPASASASTTTITSCGTATPSARFSDRYGSTPILTRPGSRLTLYGSSSDIHQQPHSIPTPLHHHYHHHRVAAVAGSNYSLDRKLRSHNNNGSLASLQPRQLSNYDSLESVRKSPSSTIDGSIINKNYRLATSSLLDLTPSPSDSGVGELEAALRDRDSELAYLRQTMEHNEAVIVRVYQEKERAWERELRRARHAQEAAVRAGAQKLFKLEQALAMQSYRCAQERKRADAEAARAAAQRERLALEARSLQERLEATEWSLCEKTGEVALLKAQAKEAHARGQEALLAVAARDRRIADVEAALEEQRGETARLAAQLVDARASPERLRREIDELRDELAEVSMSEYEGMEPGRAVRQQPQQGDGDVGGLRNELEQRQADFEKERVIWAQEKEKVLRYQRQLQMNYVQMYRRTRALEAEVESLSVELELDKTGMKKLRAANELNHTIEL